MNYSGRPLRIKIFLFAALFALSASLYAHHAVLPNFDLTKEVILADAVLTKFKFVNPHVYIYFNVPDDQGATAEWRCEMAAASRLKRRGWTVGSLLPGQVISIAGSPGLRESNVCHVDTITLANGSTLSEFAGRPSAEEVFDGLVSVADSQSRLAYLPNGQRNLSGPWVTTQQSLNVPIVEPTTEGEQAGMGLVRHFDSPALSCQPTNIVYDWIFERESNEIYQQDDKITLKYGYLDQQRTIFLNQTKHPLDLSPSVTGHSIGWWEGEVLVVDTIGFLPGVLSYVGRSGFTMHSDQWHVMERFVVSEDGRMLTRTYTFDDPLYMHGSYTLQDSASLTTEPYVPYGCEDLGGENNVRPVAN